MTKTTTSIKAVVFDFFGTLVRHRPEAGERDDLEPATSTFVDRYAKRLADLGYPDTHRGVIERHIAVWNETLEHDEHSTSGEAFERYLTEAYALLVRELGVQPGDEPAAIAALRAVDRSAVVAYDDAPACLSSLATQNLNLVVCSNWGWRLDPYLEQARIGRHIDAAVTSARVGARKPHPRVYAAALSAVGVEARDAVFVGDSLNADVLGPLTAGFAFAVHLDRSASASGGPHTRAGRIRTLSDLPEALRQLERIAEFE